MRDEKMTKVPEVGKGQSAILRETIRNLTLGTLADFSSL
jgi:hypothetical protein